MTPAEMQLLQRLYSVEHFRSKVATLIAQKPEKPAAVWVTKK